MDKVSNRGLNYISCSQKYQKWLFFKIHHMRFVSLTWDHLTKLKKVVHCTLLDLSQYLALTFDYVQRLPPQKKSKISMEIDYLSASCAQCLPLPSGSWHPYSVGQILFVVGAFEHSFCWSSILHMWYVKG